MTHRALRPRRSTHWRRWLSIVLLLWGLGCTNNPYPGADDAEKVYYQPFSEPPKTLDPQVSYASTDQAVLANVYETLLEYHYLKRPYTLVPGLTREVPVPEAREDGRIAYRFVLREGVEYGEDDCFLLAGEGRRTRTLVAADVEFALKRIADPAVNSPVIETFRKIDGVLDFRETLVSMREDPAFASLRIDDQYRRAGAIRGAVVRGDFDIEIVLAEMYPQILYWFAMPFTSPVPWEAVAYYDGERHEGVERPPFSEVAIGTGPFRLARYDKRSRITLERNPRWYGVLFPEWEAPGAIYPREGEPDDRARGFLAAAGKPLPFLDRIEMRYEKESIPTFTKFLQGYYDASGIIKESFDKVITEDRLSPEMEALGMRLEKSVRPVVRYLGFNMLDPVIGTAGGERSRKLRQAMSLAIDVPEYLRVFRNGRGIPAHTPIPPGIYGYDPEYRNPYQAVDLDRARTLLREAGYPGGVDPETGKPLRLSFDTPDTSSQARLSFLFFVEAWRQLGLDVEIRATNYNQYRQKVRNGAYQIFMWGWIADYPDPENFLFLLHSPMAQATSGGPNSANFSNAEYDALFDAMKNLPNGEERQALIRKMFTVLEEERPWIELSFDESYALFHEWTRNIKPIGLSIPTLKYRDVLPERRAALRAAWNVPIRWPAYVLALGFVVAIVPGVATFFRERQ